MSQVIVTEPRWRVTPIRYLAFGCALFILKYVIDRLVARGVFGREWSIYNYLIPTETYSFLRMPAADQGFYLTMIGIAIPFVAAGLLLTAYRLRDAGLKLWLVTFFFIPCVNLLFFSVLSLLRSKTNIPKPPFAKRVLESPLANVEYQSMSPAAVGKLIPKDSLQSVLISALVVAPFGPLMTIFGVAVLQQYGWGLFIGMPFVVGMLSTVIHGWREPRSIGSCLSTASLACVFSLMATFLFAIEGALCLIFLIPLAAPVALIGALVGYAIQANRWARVSAGNLLAMLLILPAIMGAEKSFEQTPTLFSVTTVVEVNAPLSAVWQNVVSFSEIPPPNDFFFTMGAAYPIRARIEGQGVGACRYCEFSTGAFVEPIEVWDEGKLLKFSVSKNPPPMKEWSPFKVHPPHLENYLMSQGGQFHLIDIGNGRTRLEGTTWYRHTMWPEAYWRIWTDWSIHKIHRRVLDHVKQLSERV